MIIFTVTLLLAFSKAPKAEKRKKKKDKRKKKLSKSSKSSKKSKDRKKTKKIDNKEKDVKNYPPHVFEVKKIMGQTHISYELVEGKVKFEADITCWENIAKIYTAEEEKVLKVISKGDRIWVPLRAKHRLLSLNLEQVKELYAFVANCRVITGAAKLSKKAKNEKKKIFYIEEENVASDTFVNAFEEDPNTDLFKNRRISDATEFRDSTLLSFDSSNKNPHMVFSHLFYFHDELHEFKINRIIEDLDSGKTIRSKDVVLPVKNISAVEKQKKSRKRAKGAAKKGKSRSKSNLSESKKSKESKKSDKSKKLKTKTKEGRDLRITIPGEVFFTDPNLSIYSLENTNSTITDGYFMTTVKHLMTREQKSRLHPIFIRIMKISNLPVDVLQQNGFNKISVRYSIPNVVQLTTIQKPVNSKIYFDEAHVHFLEDIDKLAFLEFMKAQQLRFEILGHRDDNWEPPCEPLMFGGYKEDAKFGQKMHTFDTLRYFKKTANCKTVILAVSSMDISQLLQPSWSLAAKNPCHNPKTLLYKKANYMPESLNLTDVITVNEINFLKDSDPSLASPLTEQMLLSNNTTLKVELYSSAPSDVLLQSQSSTVQCYQRLFLIIKQPETARALLNELFLYNQQVNDYSEVVVTNYLKTRQFMQDVTDINFPKHAMRLENASKYITGFMLDNATNYSFFLEGVTAGYMAKLWNYFRTVEGYRGKVFYNSSYLFKRRLYEEFLAFGGVYTITLQTRLSALMKESKLYVSGNIPMACRDALTKLVLLFKCPTFKIMVQRDLFPTAQQLISLDLEWGVPIRWKKDDSWKMPVESEEIATAERRSNLGLTA